jgi:cytochrome c oxidase assembly factor CtaG
MHGVTALVAHDGRPTPGDLWAHWNADPVIVLTLAALAGAYASGRRRRHRPGPPGALALTIGGFAALVVALVSPLDALAGELASAHMVQHVLLVLVAAPLLAAAGASATIATGAPRRLRLGVLRLRRTMPGVSRAWRSPSVLPAVWLAHAATVWFWHAAGPYGAALDHDLVHALEHATFTLTALAFWSAVVHAARSTEDAARGRAAFAVFTMAFQSVLLAALLTFATTPWYDGYLDRTTTWGLEPLADQQLAGAIMWVPAGLVYVGAGIALAVGWVRATGRDGVGAEGDWTSGPAPAAPLTRRT